MGSMLPLIWAAPWILWDLQTLNQSAPHANSIPSSLECLLLEYVAYDSLRQLGGVGSSAKASAKGLESKHTTELAPGG